MEIALNLTSLGIGTLLQMFTYGVNVYVCACRASSIGSSEPIVSTDGLGSSLSVTPRSLPEESYRPEEPYRPAFTRTAFTGNTASSEPHEKQVFNGYSLAGIA